MKCKCPSCSAEVSIPEINAFTDEWFGFDTPTANLKKEEGWEEFEYICPKCEYLSVGCEFVKE